MTRNLGNAGVNSEDDTGYNMDNGNGNSETANT